MILVANESLTDETLHHPIRFCTFHVLESVKIL